MKSLYIENYKTLIKEIKEEINNRKIPCVHRLKELTFSQSLYFCKTSKIQCNIYQDSNDTFHRNRKNNHKIGLKPQKTQIAQAFLRKKKKAGGILLTDVKLLQNCKTQNNMVLA